MNTIKINKVEAVLQKLHKDAKNDYSKIAKVMMKSIFRPMRPKDFEQAYLPITEPQGLKLKDIIIKHNCKNVIEFGTSFGISTIYLAQAVKETGGKVVTTELLESKANIASRNINEAGLESYVEIKVGDAMQTLKNVIAPIDFLFLDGWKDLYLPLFQMLESRFHEDTIIYADNMDMTDTKPYARYLLANENVYKTVQVDSGKAFLTTVY